VYVFCLGGGLSETAVDPLPGAGSSGASCSSSPASCTPSCKSDGSSARSGGAPACLGNPAFKPLRLPSEPGPMANHFEHARSVSQSSGAHKNKQTCPFPACRNVPYEFNQSDLSACKHFLQASAPSRCHRTSRLHRGLPSGCLPRGLPHSLPAPSPAPQTPHAASLAPGRPPPPPPPPRVCRTTSWRWRRGGATPPRGALSGTWWARSSTEDASRTTLIAS
jgi:hypothetical protein